MHNLLIIYLFIKMHFFIFNNFDKIFKHSKQKWNIEIFRIQKIKQEDAFCGLYSVASKIKGCGTNHWSLYTINHFKGSFVIPHSVAEVIAIHSAATYFT